MATKWINDEDAKTHNTKFGLSKKDAEAYKELQELFEKMKKRVNLAPAIGKLIQKTLAEAKKHYAESVKLAQAGETTDKIIEGKNQNTIQNLERDIEKTKGNATKSSDSIFP